MVRSKFGNKKTAVDGHVFDSKAEASRYVMLAKMFHDGLISDLTLQPVFQIEVNGQKVCKYIGDFQYAREDSTVVLEDVKSGFLFRDPVYRLKRKLMKAALGIDIVEVIMERGHVVVLAPKKRGSKKK